jgi:hypothetical protein
LNDADLHARARSFIAEDESVLSYGTRELEDVACLLDGVHFTMGGPDGLNRSLVERNEVGYNRARVRLTAFFAVFIAAAGCVKTMLYDTRNCRGDAEITPMS